MPYQPNKEKPPGLILFMWKNYSWGVFFFLSLPSLHLSSLSLSKFTTTIGFIFGGHYSLALGVVEELLYQSILQYNSACSDTTPCRQQGDFIRSSTFSIASS